jgi:lipopolysaccharide export system protein LptA
MALVRSLKILILAGLGALVVGVALSLSAGVRSGAGEPAPAPIPQDPAGDPIVQQGNRVSLTRSREGAPTLDLQAATSRTRASGMLELDQVSFVLYGAGGEATRITAPSAFSMPGTVAAAPASGGPGFTPSLRRNIGSWTLTGGVTLAGSGDLRLHAPSLVYDEATGVARSNDPVSFKRGPATGGAVGMEYDLGARTVRFPRDMTASMTIGGLGEVRVTAREGSYDTAARAFRMIDYQSDTSRGEHLAGATLAAVFLTEGGLERLEGSDGFELTTTHVTPAAGATSPLARLLALEGQRTMRGQRLTIRFDTDDRPATIEVSGQASVVAGAGAQGGSSMLDAETLTFDLTRGSLTRARAAGAVALSKEAGGEAGKGFRMKSENLDASFDPNAGSLLALAGEGHIQLWDEGIESQGSRSFLDPNTDVVTVLGERDAPARVTWSGRTVEARRIQVDRRRETLIARDGVRASYTPQAADASAPAPPAADPLPFFRPGETIHAIADVLTVSDEGRAARYEGNVRLWQGESRLEAGQVEVHESEGTLSAGGEVTTTFRQPPARPAAAPRSPTEDIVSVSSATMTYRRRDNRVDYAGRVLATQAAMRVTAETLAVFLKPGSGSAERMEASGQVEVRERGRVGKGDRLFVDLPADTLRLSGTGREAIVQDESSQQVVRGLALTMDRSGDRILVESELGGRTWITLKPRQKGAPGVGSDPDN